MSLKLYNTLSKEIETFSPLHKNSAVGIYHCGPTVYWAQHIGNMRAVFVVDILVRTLHFLGYKTNLVRNITDVGHLTGDNLGDADSGTDRMEKASLRDNNTPDIIAKKYTDIYIDHTNKLGALAPEHFPKATEHISEMIAMIEVLLDKKYAYTTSKAIYFDVSKVENYTKLSRQKLEELKKGIGHGDVKDIEKKNSADFSLWFFKTGTHENALQTWESPFISSLVKAGRGFPGWHIECSAMSKKYLGNTIDIHVGGIEHVPIHHTNEIAQSEAANDQTLARYWMHNEHLMVNNSKMSKSDGTSYTIDDLASRGYDAIVLRYFFLQAHYRSKQNFTWEALEASSSAISKLYSIYDKLPEGGQISEKYISLFKDSLSNDLSTAGALATLWELLKDSNIKDADKRETILAFDQILGLSLFKRTKKEIPTSIKHLAEKRMQAKKDRDFELADKLRSEIEYLGFIIRDTADGYTIE